MYLCLSLLLSRGTLSWMAAHSMQHNFLLRGTFAFDFDHFFTFGSRAACGPWIWFQTGCSSGHCRDSGAWIPVSFRCWLEWKFKVHSMCRFAKPYTAATLANLILWRKRWKSFGESFFCEKMCFCRAAKASIHSFTSGRSLVEWSGSMDGLGEHLLGPLVHWRIDCSWLDEVHRGELRTLCDCLILSPGKSLVHWLGSSSSLSPLTSWGLFFGLEAGWFARLSSQENKKTNTFAVRINDSKMCACRSMRANEFRSIIETYFCYFLQKLQW